MRYIDTDPLTRRAWRIAEACPAPALGAYPPLIRRLLAQRKITSEAQAHAFLDGAGGARPDPRLLPDIAAAIQRILQAISSADTIAVYGDYDVDGLTATTILSEGLQELGANVLTYIPNRYSEGYGVNRAALDHLRSRGARLVITVDCGISALDELRYAASTGLDVIVLDHHEVQQTLPLSVAAIDPKRSDSIYPTTELCSGGLALRLLEALYDSARHPLDEGRYLDLAALATVCDMVPLQGENRDLVKAGLPVMARTRRPGLRALLELSGLNGEAPTCETLSHRIGPRLNAAGRLGDARIALDLLTTADPEEARGLAQRLDEINRRRQAMVEEARTIAREQAEQEPADAPLLFVGDRRFSRGIVGLIATYLVQTYGRPAFVYEQGDEQCVGSARGVPGFDVVAALGQAGEFLTRHGGHRAAGGFTVATANVQRLRERLWRAATDQFGGGCPPVELEIDAEHSLQGLDRATLNHLLRFAPHGQGNAAPLILSRGVKVVGQRAVGDGSHLQLRLQDGPITWKGIAFGRASEAPPSGRHLDIVYSVEAGRKQFGPGLVIKDMALTQARG
ncbi:MAG: single-stranded-DNA-specific exonuclease RecJ [Dehalococcoidia bacterium]